MPQIPYAPFPTDAAASGGTGFARPAQASINPDAFGGPQARATEKLGGALEQAGNRPVRALQRLSALLLTGEQASLLQTKAGEAGLAVERLGFLRDGRAIEFCRSYFRGDLYDFVAELNAT